MRLPPQKTIWGTSHQWCYWSRNVARHVQSHRPRSQAQPLVSLLDGDPLWDVTSTSPPETLKEHKDSYLHHLLHQGLVRAGLGALQPADILADPCDEGELGPLAHRVPGGEAHEGKQSDVICTNGKGRARCSVKTPQIHIPSRGSEPRGCPEPHGRSQHALTQSRQQCHRLGCQFHRREVEAQKGHVTLLRLQRQMEARPL